MDYGLCLPNFRAGAAREGMEAGAEAAERLGWSTVWTTDHVMVPTSAADDYGTNYDAIEVLAWIGARFDKVRLRDERDRRPATQRQSSWPRSSRRWTP